MKKRVISMITACLLSAAAMAPSFAEDGAAAAARAAGPSDVLGSLYMLEPGENRHFEPGEFSQF